jgi:putative oxidoreductase
VSELSRATSLHRPVAAWVLLLARVGLSLEFLIFGTLKIVNSTSMQAYMERHGVPGELIWLAVLVQLGAGALVLIGYRTQLAALALAGFCVVATTMFHTHFADLGELSDFTKDLATAGGLLFLYAHGPGQWSVDAWLVRRASPG